jgi:acyl-CoA thioester hydrolase
MAIMKIEIPEKKKLVHEMVIPIRWGDMDAMGHLNNGSYFRYLETIRIDWMYAIGCRPDPRGEGPVMKMYVSDPGRSTFESWATMERSDAPGVICAAGGATTIWVDFPAQKSRPLPDWMRKIVE